MHVCHRTGTQRKHGPLSMNAGPSTSAPWTERPRSARRQRTGLQRRPPRRRLPGPGTVRTRRPGHRQRRRRLRRDPAPPRPTRPTGHRTRTRHRHHRSTVTTVGRGFPPRRKTSVGPAALPPRTATPRHHPAGVTDPPEEWPRPRRSSPACRTTSTVRWFMRSSPNSGRGVLAATHRPRHPGTGRRPPTKIRVVDL